MAHPEKKAQKGEEMYSACPRCGGETGYSLWVSEKLVADWGSDDVNLSGDIREPETVTCLDCGARVDRHRAEGQV